MLIISKEELQIIEKVEEVICNYFDVPQQKIINKDNTSQVSTARGYVFYFLHCIYGLSIGKLSLEYSKKPRTIYWNIEKIKSLVVNHKLHKEIFNNLRKELNSENEF